MNHCPFRAGVVRPEIACNGIAKAGKTAFGTLLVAVFEHHIADELSCITPIANSSLANASTGPLAVADPSQLANAKACIATVAGVDVLADPGSRDIKSGLRT